MKYLLLVFLSIALFSCSSSSSSDRDQPMAKKKNSGAQGKATKKFKSQVMVEGEDGVSRPVDLAGSRKKTFYDHATKKSTTSAGWVEMQNPSRPGKFLMGKTVRELLGLARKATPREATLIIDELLVRKESSIPALVTFLDDSRPASFQRGREYWWYEKKGKESEMVELRIYATFAHKQKISARPQGMNLVLTKDRLIYAIKDRFAVVKDDVVKLWKEWWEQARNDY